MRVRNQYTDDIDNYRIEHGVDPFIRYKEPDCSEEEKKELEDWLFNLLRSKNEVPMPVWDDHIIEQSLIQLSETDPYETYKLWNVDTEEPFWGYGYNPIGVNVLNHFFPEILDVEKKGFQSIRDSFLNDKKLRRACRKSLEYSNNELGIMRWILLRAGYCTNFRTCSVMALLEIFGKKENCKYFDSSAGYGSRLMGAHFARNVVEYLGIDPNTADHCQDEIKYLDSHFPTNTKKQVLKMGSEDFTPENFPQYQNYFDISFTSPPYFSREQYSKDPSQSYIKFPTYAEWVKGFYQATINNTCSALKRDGIFAINIFEKVPNIKDMTKLILQNSGWVLFKEDRYLLKSMPGSIGTDEEGNTISRPRDIGYNYEPVWYAKHYSKLYEEGLITKEQALKIREKAVIDTHRDEVTID